MPISERDDRPTLRDLRLRLESAPETLAAFLADVHPADLAEWMQDLDDEEADQVFACLDTEARAELLEYAEDSVRQIVVDRLTARQMADIVEELPADEVVDLLALVDEPKTEEILRQVDFELAAGLRQLSAHDPESAGGLMTTDYVSVPTGARVGDAVKAVKHEGEESEEGIGVFIVDGNERPVGFLSNHALLTNSIHDPVEAVMGEAFTVDVEADQEEVAQLFNKYGLLSLAVTDAGGALAGVISAADAAEVLEEEASEDFHRIVGTSRDEQTRLPVLVRVRHRMPLMGLTVLGGLATATLLRAFLGEAGGATTDVLRFLPIVIGLAGNVGVQSSTILVRAIATGEVERDRELSVLSTEVATGTCIGVICGAITWGVAWLLEDGADSGLFGLAIGIAIAIAVAWAAVLGSVVPVSCRRFGIDPAIVAGPALITLSDLSGTAIYIGVAHLLLPG